MALLQIISSSENCYIVYHGASGDSSRFFFINIDRMGKYNFILRRLEDSGNLCDNILCCVLKYK